MNNLTGLYVEDGNENEQFLFLFFETGTCYIAQTVLELLGQAILLPQPSQQQGLQMQATVPGQCAGFIKFQFCRKKETEAPTQVDQSFLILKPYKQGKIHILEMHVTTPVENVFLL